MKKESIPGNGIKSIRDHLQQYPERLISALLRIEKDCGHIYLAGGTIRDWLLGRPSADLDLVVQSGQEIYCRRLLSELGGGALVHLGDKQDVRVVWNQFTVDFSRFRGGSRQIEGDLLQRDFTINAMAVGLSDCVSTLGAPVLIDPMGGIKDLKAQILRGCDNAFIDDPLRILRGFRLSAVLDFIIDSSTLLKMKECASLLVHVSAERISHELDLIMESGNAWKAIKAMAESTILWDIIPELHQGMGVEQPGFHHLDVFHHCLATLGLMEEILQNPISFYSDCGGVISCYLRNSAILMRLKWAALLHDMGKPLAMEVRQEKDGRITFYNHDRIGKDMLFRLAGRLKWSNDTKEVVGTLIELHMHPFHLCNVRRRSELSNRACLKICKRAGKHLPGLFLLAMADSLASQGEKKPERMEYELTSLFVELQRIIDQKIRPVLTSPRLLNGTDLIEQFHLVPGPIFSSILAAIELAMVEGQIRDREEALDWVSQYLHNKGIQ
jgi:poly(A) polymerase